MNTRNKLFTLLLIFMVGLLAACSSEEASSESKDEKDQKKKTEEVKKESEESKKDDDEKIVEEKEEDNQEKEEKNESSGVEPNQTTPSEQLRFTRISFFHDYMAPDRQPKPGIWIYTKEDHPEMFDDEQYDWDKYDMLLWQISDEEMKGKSYKTDSLMLNENEITIKVNFYYGETDPEGKFPRQYLLVEKGILDGKTFKIETIDGEELSLQ